MRAALDAERAWKKGLPPVLVQVIMAFAKSFPQAAFAVLTDKARRADMSFDLDVNGIRHTMDIVVSKRARVIQAARAKDFFRGSS